MANKSTWTYNKSAVVTLPDGSKENYSTQLYRVGVYIIWNDHVESQGNMTPKDMERMCKKIKKDLTAGNIVDVQWGGEITIEQDEKGLFVEVQ
jgi:hypothetical protein